MTAEYRTLKERSIKRPFAFAGIARESSSSAGTELAPRDRRRHDGQKGDSEETSRQEKGREA